MYISLSKSNRYRKREICLLHIKDYNSTISIYNKKIKLTTNKLFFFRNGSLCMELENDQNKPNRLTCDFSEDKLSQKWIFEIEGSYFKIRNSKFNKCLSLPIGAVVNDHLVVEDCIVNKFEQQFSRNINTGFKISIKHYSGLCIFYDFTNNPNYFQAGNCESNSQFEFYIFRKQTQLYNPFFKKCIHLEETNAKIKNCEKNIYQKFDVYLIDPILDEYLLYNDNMFAMIKVSTGNEILSSGYSFDISSKFFLQWIKPGVFKIKSEISSQCITINKFLIEEGNSIFLNDSCIMKDTNLWRFLSF